MTRRKLKFCQSGLSILCIFLWDFSVFATEISGLHLVVKVQERHTFMDNIILKAHFKLRCYLKHKQCIQAYFIFYKHSLYSFFIISIKRILKHKPFVKEILQGQTSISFSVSGSEAHFQSRLSIIFT